MAQLAEQLTCNQQVIGSSPIVGFSKIKALGNFLKSLDLFIIIIVVEKFSMYPLHLSLQKRRIWYDIYPGGRL